MKCMLSSDVRHGKRKQGNAKVHLQLHCSSHLPQTVLLQRAARRYHN